MRERSKVEYLPPAYETQMFEDHQILPGNPPWVTNIPWLKVSGPAGKVELYCRDEVTPNFLERINNGEIINNAMFAERSQEVPPQAVNLNLRIEREDWDGKKGHKRYGTYVPFSYYGNRPGLLPGSVEVDEMRQAVYDLAVTQAYSKVSPASFMSGATLAEGSKTIQSLVDVTRRTVKIARAVKKLNFAYALQLTKYGSMATRKGGLRTRSFRNELSLKKLEDDYMQARYGIRPIIYDVNGMIDAYKKERKFDRFTARGFATDSMELSDVLHSVPFWHDTMCDVKRKYRVSVEARAGVLYTGMQDWTSLSGASKLAETAWELLPFSFIFDWVANIGSTIAAHTPKAGVNQLASWCTVMEKYDRTNEVSDYHLTPEVMRDWTSTSLIVSPCAYGTVLQKTTRIVDPLPRTWPRFDLNLSVYKLLDLGIILKKFL